MVKEEKLEYVANERFAGRIDLGFSESESGIEGISDSERLGRTGGTQSVILRVARSTVSRKEMAASRFVRQ